MFNEQKYPFILTRKERRIEPMANCMHVFNKQRHSTLCSRSCAPLLGDHSNLITSMFGGLGVDLGVDLGLSCSAVLKHRAWMDPFISGVRDVAEAR